MPTSERLYNIAVKIEDPAGTYSTPEMATDAVRLSEKPQISFGYSGDGNRDGAAVGGFGRPVSLAPVGGWIEVSLVAEMIHSGTPVTPALVTRLLLPFMKETADATGGAVYHEISWTDGKPLSLMVQHAGYELQVTGAVPTRTVIRGDALGRMFIETTLVGILSAKSDQALEAATYDLTVPEPLLGANIFTVDSINHLWRSIEIDFGITSVTPRDRISGNAAAGLLFGVVTNIDPVIRFIAETEALADFNPWTDGVDEAEIAKVFSLALGPVDTQFNFDADFVEYRPEFSLADENGLTMWDLTLGVIRPVAYAGPSATVTTAPTSNFLTIEHI
jgi:hypothetical protein